MPPVIVAAITTAIVSSIPGLIVTSFIGSIISAGISFLVSTGLRALMGGGKQQRQSFTRQLQERTQMIKAPNSERQTIYGTIQVSGSLLFYEASSDNKTHHMVIAFASHECVGFQLGANKSIYIDDFLLPELNSDDTPESGKYLNAIFFKFHFGGAGQVADTDLVTDTVIRETDTFSGISYVYVKFVYSQALFPTGIPNIKFTISGKKIYDPRTGNTQYSSNPALVALDWLLTQYGADLTDIDAASWIAAANICDETVATVSGSEARYTANGLILSSTKHREAMTQILSSCAGNLTSPQGVYRLTVGAYTAPVASYDENILRGEIKVRPKPTKKDLFNRVNGTFVNPVNFWQPSDFTSVSNSTYATQDGEDIGIDIVLGFTTSSATAQRLAKIMLEKSRQGITVDMPTKLNALEVLPFENIQLSIDNLGWTNKIFKVIEVKIEENGGTNLVLQEEASGVYDWSAEETVSDLAPNTSLPVYASIGLPTNLQMTEELYKTSGSVGVRSKVILTWDAPDDAFIKDYEVEFRLLGSIIPAGSVGIDGSIAGTLGWQELFNIRSQRYEIIDMMRGSYEFRVKAYNIFGANSGYQPIPVHFHVYGLTAPPSPVEHFSVTVINGMATAVWAKSNDLDVIIGGRIVIRHSASVLFPTWEKSVIITDINGDAESASLPLIEGVYFAKFVDSTGNYSIAAQSFQVTEALITGWVTDATINEHTAFAGTKTNVEYVTGSSGDITLSVATTIDGRTELIDCWSSIDGYNPVFSDGTYDFTSTLDLGTIAVRRYHSHIIAEQYFQYTLFDELGFVDALGFIDDIATVNSANAYVEISVSDDNATFTPFAPFTVADFSGKFAKFRAKLSSLSEYQNIKISELGVIIKTPI